MLSSASAILRLTLSAVRVAHRYSGRSQCHVDASDGIAETVRNSCKGQTGNVEPGCLLNLVGRHWSTAYPNTAGFEVAGDSMTAHAKPSAKLTECCSCMVGIGHFIDLRGSETVDGPVSRTGHRSWAGVGQVELAVGRQDPLDLWGRVRQVPPGHLIRYFQPLLAYIGVGRQP